MSETKATSASAAHEKENNQTNNVAAMSNEHIDNNNTPDSQHGSAATVTEDTKLSDGKSLTPFEERLKYLENKIRILYNENTALEALDMDELNKRLEEYDTRDMLIQKLEAQHERLRLKLESQKKNSSTDMSRTNSNDDSPDADTAVNADITVESNISQEITTPATNSATKNQTTSVKGVSTKKTKKYLLHLQKDDMGVFYKFTTTAGETYKYYPEVANNSIAYELRALEDFPNWCQEVEMYLEAQGFDNVIEMDPSDSIPDDENALLYLLLKESVRFKMLNYFKQETNILKILADLRKYYCNRFTTKMRDKEWSRIVIDKTCSDAEEAKNILSDMVCKELYGNIGLGLRRRDNEFINDLILETLEKSLMDEIRYNHRLKEDVLRKMLPTELVDLVADELLGYCSKNTSRGKQLCNKCKSALHSTQSCALDVGRDGESPTAKKASSPSTKVKGDQRSYQGSFSAESKGKQKGREKKKGTRRNSDSH